MTEPTKPNENEEQRSAPEQTPPMQPIVDMGAVTTRTARGTVYCLTVVGQIEGHSLLPNTVKTTKYEHVLPLLAALDESEEIDGLLLLLNTVGGDIEAGLAIAELIAGMKKPTVSLVRRRTLHRDPACGLGKKEPDRPHSQHDGPSRPHDRACRRCAADIPVF